MKQNTPSHLSASGLQQDSSGNNKCKKKAFPPARTKEIHLYVKQVERHCSGPRREDLRQRNIGLQIVHNRGNHLHSLRCQINRSCQIILHCTIYNPERRLAVLTRGGAGGGLQDLKRRRSLRHTGSFVFVKQILTQASPTPHTSLPHHTLAIGRSGRPFMIISIGERRSSAELWIRRGFLPARIHNSTFKLRFKPKLGPPGPPLTLRPCDGYTYAYLT